MGLNENASDRPLNELDIHAYVDGTLTGDRASRVAAYLRSEPGEARRAGFYAHLNRRLREAADQSGTTAWRRAIALRPRAFVTRFGRIVRFVSVVAVALGAMAGWAAATHVTSEQLDAAVIMALTKAEGEHWSARTPEIADAGVPDLSTAGLRLVERRSMNVGWFVRIDSLVYLNAGNEPVIYASMPAPYRPVRTSWTACRVGAARLLTWRRGWRRFVIAGDARTRGLMLAADSAAKE